jgi:formylglycine-generating enzyme required for sulfatase activity
VIPVLVDNAAMPAADDLPLDLRELAFKNATVVRDDPDFHTDVTRIIRSLGAPVASPARPVAFNALEAISRFYGLFEDENWDAARALLVEIRASGKAPKVFNLDQHEQEIWDAMLAEEREAEYDVLRLMAQRANTAGVWDALQVFWQSYPDYDPDQLVRFKPAAPPLLSKVLTSAGGLTSKRAPQQPKSPPRVQKADSTATIRAVIGDPFEWCAVPAGEFLYGEDKRKLTLPTFQIAKYPITYQQFEAFVAAKDGFADSRWWQGLAGGKPIAPGKQAWKIADHPRENVSWYDAIAFCRWLSFKVGGGTALEKVNEWAVRLPTEFEWERAARGTDGREYPYGNTFDATQCNTRESGKGQTTPVTAYPAGASPVGALDMCGNVWEWCLTDYGKPAADAAGEVLSSDNGRVVRGGSWGNYPGSARAAYRDYGAPLLRFNISGFRVFAWLPIS